MYYLGEHRQSEQAVVGRAQDRRGRPESRQTDAAALCRRPAKVLLVRVRGRCLPGWQQGRCWEFSYRILCILFRVLGYMEHH